MYIPDPIELFEAAQDRLIHEWSDANRGVPDGSYRCPYCSRVFVGEPIMASDHPASPAMCFDCLPDTAKVAYQKFFGGL